jgi:ADP-ribose pyrophosphatase
MSTDDRKWEIIESEYLIRRPWLTARRDRVKLPTGVEIPEYYILEYPDWVNVIAITKEGKFVLVRQYRHGIKETRYEICAGVCETGEEPLLSAQRELYEETGYGNGNWTKLMTISANASTMTNITHCYLATEVERISTQHLEETEDLTVRRKKDKTYKIPSGNLVYTCFTSDFLYIADECPIPSHNYIYALLCPILHLPQSVLPMYRVLP